jgi:transcriptional regulator with XRE-family HTH domain
MVEPVVNFQEVDPVSVASRLRKAREDAGHTRKTLAKATGIPSSTIEKIERGDNEPSLSRLKVLCRVLELDINDIMNEVDPPADAPENPDDGDDLAKMRRQLAGMAHSLGMRVIFPHESESPEPLKIGLVETEEAEPEDVSRTALVERLAEFVQDNGGPRARGVRKRSEDLDDELSEAEWAELLDIADDIGLRMAEAEKVDEAEPDQVTALKDRIAVYAASGGVDLRELHPKALERLNQDLAKVLPDLEGEEVVESGVFERADTFAARSWPQLASVWLDAVEKRKAPDLRDKHRYPRRDSQTKRAAEDENPLADW